MQPWLHFYCDPELIPADNRQPWSWQADRLLSIQHSTKDCHLAPWAHADPYQPVSQPQKAWRAATLQRPLRWLWEPGCSGRPPSPLSAWARAESPRPAGVCHLWRQKHLRDDLVHRSEAIIWEDIIHPSVDWLKSFSEYLKEPEKESGI